MISTYYSISELQEEDMAEDTKKKEHKEEEKSLEKMTVKELKAIAMEIPRSVAVHDMKKAELIDFIKEARGITEEAPAKVVKKVEKKIKLSKSEIKRIIKKLKEEKKAAQTTNSREKTDFLRRRISHLKKQTRRLENV
jgi:Asp-tRNA(Asn)/Glu-tRNA(Gln) amidotransferase A subunit family amidase